VSSAAFVACSSRDRHFDRSEQLTRLDGLGEEVVCPRLDRPHRNADFRVGGQKHDGPRRADIGQAALELRPAQARHLDVEKNAARSVLVGQLIQQLLRGGVGDDPISGRFQQSLSGCSIRRVVIHDIYDAGQMSPCQEGRCTRLFFFVASIAFRSIDVGFPIADRFSQQEMLFGAISMGLAMSGKPAGSPARSG
jgi:hypothetical protein